MGVEERGTGSQARPTSTIWALGDYRTLAREVLAGLGPRLVAACGVAPGQRVLDVGAGTGVAAIPAAEAGAEVVAVDVTPELIEAGRAEAATRPVTIEWREADAQDLPFPDGEFDVVMSCIGAMFAPDHRATADEMLRVCRPGGTIGMINWTPDGSIGEFFRVFAGYAPPPPPGSLPPALWGTQAHARELFGDRVESLATRPESLPVERFADPAEYRAYYKDKFGPTIATYAHVADRPELVAALDRDFLSYAERANVNGPGQRARYEYEYLLTVARKRAR
jgi:SAM-dependent methyltransferase